MEPSSLKPWRLVPAGAQLALRVTPRGGRDAVDGIETLSDGRSVLKLRVRAVADAGEANRAVIALLAKLLDVPKAAVQLISGATSRLKQVAISGDPATIDQALRALTADHKPTAKN